MPTESPGWHSWIQIIVPTKIQRLSAPSISSPSTCTKFCLISKASLSLKGGRAVIDGTEGGQAGAGQGSAVAVANSGCNTGQPGWVSLTAAALHHFKASFFRRFWHHLASTTMLAEGCCNFARP